MLILFTVLKKVFFKVHVKQVAQSSFRCTTMQSFRHYWIYIYNLFVGLPNEHSIFTSSELDYRYRIKGISNLRFRDQKVKNFPDVAMETNNAGMIWFCKAAWLGK